MESTIRMFDERILCDSNYLGKRAELVLKLKTSDAACAVEWIMNFFALTHMHVEMDMNGLHVMVEHAELESKLMQRKYSATRRRLEWKHDWIQKRCDYNPRSLKKKKNSQTILLQAPRLIENY